MVLCELTSTTMLVELVLAAHVWVDEQSSDGGQPPQVPPQPSLPQVFPVQSGAHPVDPPAFELLLDVDAVVDPELDV